MKKLEAIVEPFQLPAMREALSSIGIDGMTISDVHRHGGQNGRKIVYRGHGFKLDLMPKVRFDVVVSDERVNEAVGAIARSGGVVDNRILVYDIAEAVGIRSGDRYARADHQTAA